VKKALLFTVALMALTAGAAVAFDWNPVHWVTGGAESALKTLGGLLFTAFVAWLGKGKWDSVQLKRAVYEIKGSVDLYRKASGQASPGGTKVTVQEAGEVAGKALTGVLSALRGINPAWIPHI